MHFMSMGFTVRICLKQVFEGVSQIRCYHPCRISAVADALCDLEHERQFSSIRVERASRYLTSTPRHSLCWLECRCLPTSTRTPLPNLSGFAAPRHFGKEAVAIPLGLV